MIPYTSPPVNPTFEALYTLLLGELSKATERDEQRRLLDLLQHALHAWSDIYTERMEREVGTLLLARVDDAHVVRELTYVLYCRQSPASQRILIEAARRAFEQRHGASLVELVGALVDWIGSRDALLDLWVERAIEVGITGFDEESTALIASRYLRHRPERAPWLKCLLRQKPEITCALCAEVNLLCLAPSVEGLLEWCYRADSIDDAEFPTGAPWLDFGALEPTFARARERADDEQAVSLERWGEWLGRAHVTHDLYARDAS